MADWWDGPPIDPSTPKPTPVTSTPSTEEYYEFQVEIGGVNYGMDVLTEANIKQPLFDQMSVGLACCAELSVSYYVGDLPEPPRGAKMIPRCRKRGSNDAWYQLGIFYIDVRKERAGKKTLLAYDSMMRADVQFIYDNEWADEWPMPMTKAVNIICQRMGVTLDPRTQINTSYTLEYPNEDHMRDMLMYVAAAHAGNWIVTNKGQLLLIPLVGSMPPETWFLVEEHGMPIKFGEDRIVHDAKGRST